MRWLVLLLLLFLYRCTLSVLATAIGVRVGVEALGRGVTPDELEGLAQRASARAGPVWDRYRCRRWGRWTLALWVSVRGMRVELSLWPWLWPLWIGAFAEVSRRAYARCLDDRWRVR